MKIPYLLIISICLVIWSCGSKTQNPTPVPPKPNPPADTTKTTPTLTDFLIPPKTFGDADFSITPPKSNSSGAFIYTSSNVAIAQITGNTVSIKASGSVTITAKQAALGNYASAEIATTLIIAPAKTVIGKFNVPVLDRGTYYHLIAPQSNSPASFQYTSINPLVATVSNDTLFIVGAGQTMIVAQQKAVAGYTASSSADTVILTSSLATIGGPVADIDGNIYSYATIGNQVWLTRNLTTTKYRDGSAIAQNADYSVNGWGALTTGVQTIYNNDPTKEKTYGRLYNWYAAADKRNIAPQGWHVSTEQEWQALFARFGGRENAASVLRRTANPATDFNGGLYAGVISNIFGSTQKQEDNKYIFRGVGTITKFWYAGEDGRGNVLGLRLDDFSAVPENARKQDGVSVRCLQDYTVTFTYK